MNKYIDKYEKNYNFIKFNVIAWGTYFLTTIIAWGLIFLLDRHISNGVFYVMLISLMGPYISALIKEKEEIRNKKNSNTDYKDITIRRFLNRYMINFKNSYLITLLITSISFIIIVDIYYVQNINPAFSSSSIFYFILLIVLFLIWFNLLLITSLFKFRLLDIFKLASFYLVTNILTTLKNLLVLIISIIVTLRISNFLVILFLPLIFQILFTNSLSTIEDIKLHYIR